MGDGGGEQIQVGFGDPPQKEYQAVQLQVKTSTEKTSNSHKISKKIIIYLGAETADQRVRARLSERRTVRGDEFHHAAAATSSAAAATATTATTATTTANHEPIQGSASG